MRCTAFRILLGAPLLLLHAASVRAEFPPLQRIQDEPAFLSIRTLLGPSKRGLAGQCQTGKLNILARLDALRADPENARLFDDYDYGPVEKSQPFGHEGVIVYHKRQPGESYDEAIADGAVIDHTNYWSNISGEYVVRSWEDWRWHNVAGKGQRDLDLKYARSYWNPAGPVYPPPAPAPAPEPAPHNPNPLLTAAWPVDLVYSLDPNAKMGPPGAGSARWIGAGTGLAYTIFFENLASANAPAQEVVVTDRLDGAVLDLDTVALGDLVFGDQTVSLPPGAIDQTIVVDLRPARPLSVRVAVTLDRATGDLVWRFTSLDPTTGEPPRDALAGFLPANVHPPEGEGHVTFTVSPLPGLATGTLIQNRARIVFDHNAPIETPAWQNTIDASAPTSAVTSAAMVSCSPVIEVAWQGADAEAGVRDHDLLVSEDGGPFFRWKQATNDVRATFQGRWGSTYGFASVARDAADNEEAWPATPDLAVTIAECAPHDLAVTKISTRRSLDLTARKPQQVARVHVLLQNRSPVAEVIRSPEALSALVDLVVDSSGSCASPTATSLGVKTRKPFPIVLAPRGKLKLAFRVPIDCANDPLGSSRADPGHDDFSLRVVLDRAALGGLDADPADDVCPRVVSPPGVVDPYPDGKIRDRGCGARRPDGTHGDPVLLDVRVRP